VNCGGCSEEKEEIGGKDNPGGQGADRRR
jgi:hypothetical protein